MVPYYVTGSGVPTYNCTAGRDTYTDTVSSQFYFCAQINTWQRLARRTVLSRTATDTLSANADFAGVTPLAASSLAAGAVIEAVWSGSVSATTADMTFSLAPKAAGSVVVDAPIALGPLTALIDRPWQASLRCVVLTTGASGTMECSGSAVLASERLFLSTAVRALDTAAATDLRLNLSGIAGTGILTAILRQMTVTVN